MNIINFIRIHFLFYNNKHTFINTDTTFITKYTIFIKINTDLVTELSVSLFHMNSPMTHIYFLLLTDSTLTNWERRLSPQ
jgi:hypothetical protein